MSLKHCHSNVKLCVALACAISSAAFAQTPGAANSKHFAWSDATLSPDARADMVVKQMTLDEKISLLHGQGMPFFSKGPSDSNGGAGYTAAIPRLGIPSIQMADSAYGVTRGMAMGRYSTALPSDLAEASSWDTGIAFRYGALIGRELRDEGYSMSLGGGVNLTREPRDGRTFEYQGEDPLLAGTMAGNLAKGVQSQQVIGDLKHYALNDQESGRNAVNVNIDKRSMRESDLLAFQIALGISHAGAIMCSYNRVNRDYACENSYLLTDVLKRDFDFKGFVVSDWGGTHSAVKASHAGLDQEQPGEYFYGADLKKAVEDREVSGQELDDHVHRVLRTIFASGLYDHPVDRQVPDVEKGLMVAQSTAEESLVLLKNSKGILPLDPATLRSVAVVGGYADKGVLTGGGSAQVDPPGGTVVPPRPPGPGLLSAFLRPAWLADPPLRAIERQFPSAKVSFIPGEDPAAAAAAARSADVAIVFAYQWESEAMDLPTLDLSDDQNKLIEAVAAANRRTVVVLETGGPATMPWVDNVAGVIEAWYPGIRGAEALAEILSGKVNPSAKLAVTFPRSDADLPHPKLVLPPPESEPNLKSMGGDISNFMSIMAKGLPPFQVFQNEKLEVGYKWYDAQHKPVLFPFGFGLSYTEFAYSGLTVSGTGELTVSFTVKNTGSRPGTEIAEIYASLPDAAQEPPKRLIGWSRIELASGESKQVSIPVDRSRLSIYDEASDSWKLVPGQYTVRVGGSSRELPLQQSLQVR